MRVSQFIRGIEKAWFSDTKRAGFAIAHTAPYRKIGFTLAEVLITLGIIGVVAALTIPSFVQKYKEQETVVRVKKFYSVFSQAYTQAILDNGTIDNWGLDDSKLVEDEDGDMVHSDLSLENYDLFLQKMKPYLKNVTYQKLSSGKNLVKGYVLPDGTAIIGMWLRPSLCVNETIYCGDFYITTDLKQYMSGDDKFTFAFQFKKNKIEPFGSDNSTFKNFCLNGENRSRCTGWIIANGNMDYLRCKDLDYDKKTKCK